METFIIQESMMADYEINEILDCSGLTCPMPIVKTGKAIKKMQVGEIIKMISTDPGSMGDMRAWVKRTGHEMLSAVQEESNYQFVVKKMR